MKIYFSGNETGMDDCKDHQGRIKGQNDPEYMEQGAFFGIMGQEAEQTVEPENKGHQGPYIFPDHFKFLVPAIMIADPHIVQGPEGG